MNGTAPLPRCMRTGCSSPSPSALRRGSQRRQAARHRASCQASYSSPPSGRLPAKDRTQPIAAAGNALIRTIAAYPADGIANTTPQA